eukprot:5266500-Amphidinium_carterae.1
MKGGFRALIFFGSAASSVSFLPACISFIIHRASTHASLQMAYAASNFQNSAFISIAIMQSSETSLCNDPPGGSNQSRKTDGEDNGAWRHCAAESYFPSEIDILSLALVKASLRR